MEDKKSELFKCGKELFSTKGFKDTNIADITKMAGVAVGTFYNYYPSKEKLFMEIFQEENVKLMKTLTASIDMNDEPIRIIHRMMESNIKGMLENPILMQWYNKDVYAKIERLFKDENGLNAADFLYRDAILMVRAWQDEGKMRNDISSEMIMAIFGAIINIGMHKEEIGLQYFPDIQYYLTEFVMKGLAENQG